MIHDEGVDDGDGYDEERCDEDRYDDDDESGDDDDDHGKVAQRCDSCGQPDDDDGDALVMTVCG